MKKLQVLLDVDGTLLRPERQKTAADERTVIRVNHALISALKHQGVTQVTLFTAYRAKSTTRGPLRMDAIRILRQNGIEVVSVICLATPFYPNPAQHFIEVVAPAEFALKKQRSDLPAEQQLETDRILAITESIDRLLIINNKLKKLAQAIEKPHITDLLTKIQSKIDCLINLLDNPEELTPLDIPTLAQECCNFEMAVKFHISCNGSIGEDCKASMLVYALEVAGANSKVVVIDNNVRVIDTARYHHASCLHVDMTSQRQNQEYYIHELAKLGIKPPNKVFQNIWIILAIITVIPAIILGIRALIHHLSKAADKNLIMSLLDGFTDDVTDETTTPRQSVAPAPPATVLSWLFRWRQPNPILSTQVSALEPPRT